MPAGRLTELLIDDATWSAGTTVRRHEWRLAIDEILHDGRFVLPDGEARATVTLAPTRVVVEVRGADGHVTARDELPLATLRPLMAEYMETIGEMAKLGVSQNSPRLEALDIAKRITHDEAGETVVSLLRTLAPDHGTARRFFTLLVTLLYDTTRLGHASDKPSRR
ncbi:MAG TPA: UPF0262 family protein [Polyangia bacterium]|jgi:uncharacterized protein (UPF0262 family)|nr:UPF0262 family protein [Polyangia bacterium]